MSYQVLARKWRPQNFKQMVGQEHVLKALIHALDSQRLHHAYLFTGTRGVGKTTIGRILAKCLSCDTGITSEPCGTCGACTSITEGRYVDLIEIDAASRTKVEDMRELLDNVQYAPSEGRFKIYLIDEVHMLSQSSFNALLKTLEEPPEHVKFLFATTDPQKLPVTILSRCLQFNLKNMSPERVVGHLQHILGQEQVSFEEPALWALARAADGSMRDALSLTDQAIAYGQHQLSEENVSAMLGTVDQKRVYRILHAAIGNDARLMLEEVKALAEFSPDYSSVLASIISILHRVAVEQAVPGATDNAMGDQSEVVALAAALCAEDLQLFYQIALTSRQDMESHPDPRAGLEMALIRMMAFQLDRPVSATDGLPELGAEAQSSPVSASESEALPEAVDREPVQSDRNAPDMPTPPLEAYEPDMASDEPSQDHLDEPPLAVAAQSHPDDSASGKKKTELGSEAQPPFGKAENVASTEAIMPAELADSAADHSAELSDAVAFDSNDPAVSDQTDSSASSSSCANGDMAWPRKVLEVGVTGMTQNLLFNMVPERQDEKMTLYVESGHYRLLNDGHQKRIESAMQACFGEQIQVHFADGLKPGQETPMMWRERRAAELLADARVAVKQDPNVQALMHEFDAVLVEESIKALGQL